MPVFLRQVVHKASNGMAQPVSAYVKMVRFGLLNNKDASVLKASTGMDSNAFSVLLVNTGHSKLWAVPVLKANIGQD